MAAVQRPLFVSAPGPASLKEIEKTLWEAADELRANSKLKSSEYSVPVLGLIFLRFADHKFAQAQQELAATAQATGSRRTIGKADYQARGIMYLPDEARFEQLLQLPEGENIGKAINDAMKAIEAENDELKDVLPKTYNRLENDTLVALLKTFSRIPVGIEGDAFGKIYEYFLGKFAMAEGQKGGEFFTPTSLVKLIVEVIEPNHGRIFDPACGSGGMFVQSARFVANHQRNPNAEISIFGQEKTAETVRLCRMNLAVHGLSGDIRQGNTYYENLHSSVGRFDFVMANPPFNVDKVDKEKIKDDPRYPFGVPRADNANYLWIQEFWSALDEHGRAGFVMANSAADARGTEVEIRRKLIEARAVDVMISIGPNFFYTVTLPCTLWFLDKGKQATPRQDQVLFVDARQIFKQIDRAHREFTPEQIEYIANIVRLYRGEEPETAHAVETLLLQRKVGLGSGDGPVE
jgi:type I restriction enzyme M protein